MCVVSMITDHYTDRWRPWVQPSTGDFPPGGGGGATGIPSSFILNLQSPLTAEEILTVRRFIEQDLPEFKLLLERARAYDARNNEPNCELAEKKRILKEIADKIGVDISFIDQ